MKKQAQVVILPTEDKSSIILDKNNKAVYLDDLQTSIQSKDNKNQHVYVTVPQDVEPIKEGDWAIGFAVGIKGVGRKHFLWQHTGNSISKLNAICEGSTKIIATDDPKLYNARENNAPFRRLSTNPKELQQSFIKEFVDNPEGKWEVEYNSRIFIPDGTIYDLVVNQDNTISITSVEEKLYTLTQLVQMFEDGFYQGGLEDSPVSDARLWIKENLK